MPINVSIQGLDKIRDAKLTLLFYQLHLKLNETANFFQMTYFGREDILKYRACRIFNTAITHPNMNAKIPLTQEILDYILSTEFPKEKFSEYHQRIIETNPKDFDIIIGEKREKELYGLLQINEDGNKLVLTKAKK